MAAANNPPKTIGEVIDQLDQIREELFSLQRSLEKIDPIKIIVLDPKASEDQCLDLDATRIRPLSLL